MRHLHAEGIVIKRSNFSEADKILTLFTKTQGKISVKAKGVRKITSRKSGSVELFNKIKFSAVRGRQFDIITEVDTQDSYPQLKIDLTRVGVAYHLCELVDKLIPEHQENPGIYNLLDRSLADMDKNSQLDLSKHVREFEKRILISLGFGIPENPTQSQLVAHIENILERPLKSRQVLHAIASNHSGR